MKATEFKYRNYRISKQSTGWVITKRGEYVNTLPELWLAEKYIDNLVCGY